MCSGVSPTAEFLDVGREFLERIAQHVSSARAPGGSYGLQRMLHAEVGDGMAAQIHQSTAHMTLKQSAHDIDTAVLAHTLDQTTATAIHQKSVHVAVRDKQCSKERRA